MIGRTLRRNSLTVALALGGACIAFLANAQPIGTATTTPGTLEKTEYVDRFLTTSDGDLAPIVREEETRMRTGWPRSWSLALSGGSSAYDQNRVTSLGLALRGYIDTPTIGAWNADFGLIGDQSRGGKRQGAISGYVENRRLPLNDGWYATHALGLIGSDFRQPGQLGRVRLPSTPILGVSGRYENAATHWDISASAGQPGRLIATPQVDFDKTADHLLLVGASKHDGKQGASLAFATANDVLDFGTRFKRTHALFASADTKFANVSVQGSLVVSEARRVEPLVDAGKALAVGAWIDMRFRAFGLTHDAGIFRFEPNLVWGTLNMANNLEGGYLRTASASRQTSWDTAVELFRPLSGNRELGLYATGNWRHQYHSKLAFGGNLSLRKQAATDVFASVFITPDSHWGRTRVQLDASQSSASVDDEKKVRLQIQQSWRSFADLSVSTGAEYEHARSKQGRDNAMTLTVLASGGLGERISFDVSARARLGLQSSQGNAYDTAANLNWDLTPRLTLGLSANFNRGAFPVNPVLDPLAPPFPPSTRPIARTILLTLRYQDSNGRPFSTPLGGTAASAAGTLRGTVFLDINGNGERDAGEQPAANIVVVLDGRFSTRTDSSGQFRFERVAVGEHRLEAQTDNLPLPWGFENTQRTVVLRARDVSQVNFGATRSQ